MLGAAQIVCVFCLVLTASLTLFLEENKQIFTRENRSDSDGGKSIKLETSPQTSSVPLSDTTIPSNFQAVSAPDEEDYGVPSAPYIEQNEFPMPTMSVDFSEPQRMQPSISPPLTPRSTSPLVSRRSFSEPASPSPKLTQSAIPPSPYNPLLTPSFRHSPPRLPSDQPWRFPSPSHPLHSRARELCLGMVVRGAASPSTRGVSALDSSPTSILNTPAIIHQARGTAPDSEDTDHLGSSPMAMRASPRSLFGASPYPSNMDRSHRVDDSPLGRLMRKKNHSRQKSSLSTFSEIGNDWFSDTSAPSSSGLGVSNGLLTPMRLGNDDPFGMYGSWGKEPKSANGKSGHIATMDSPGDESPVLRSSQLQPADMGGNNASFIGLGIGLMAPFTFPDRPFQFDEADSSYDTDFGLSYPQSPSEERDEAEVEGALAAIGPPGLPKQGLRRAHTFIAGPDVDNQEDDQFELSAPPLKRRRTVGGG